MFFGKKEDRRKKELEEFQEKFPIGRKIFYLGLKEVTITSNSQYWPYVGAVPALEVSYVNEKGEIVDYTIPNTFLDKLQLIG